MTTFAELVGTYVKERLYHTPELRDYIKESFIFATQYYEDGKIWDIMILLEDELFASGFVPLYGECFVVDDHIGERGIFTRVKSFSWLKGEFSRRLIIILWIIQNSVIIQDKRGDLQRIIDNSLSEFESSCIAILGKKYIELRTERHNLRFSVRNKDCMSRTASAIVKANFIKLCLEVRLLAERKLYPFKVLLSESVVKNIKEGSEFLELCQRFLDSQDANETIDLSEKIIDRIISVLGEKRLFSDDFLQKWWLHLS